MIPPKDTPTQITGELGKLEDKIVNIGMQKQDKEMSLAYHDLTWSTTAAKSSEFDAHYEMTSSYYHSITNCYIQIGA